MVAAPLVEQVEGVHVEENEIKGNCEHGDRGQIDLRPAAATKPGHCPGKELLQREHHVSRPDDLGQAGSSGLPSAARVPVTIVECKLQSRLKRRG